MKPEPNHHDRCSKQIDPFLRCSCERERESDLRDFKRDQQMILAEVRELIGEAGLVNEAMDGAQASLRQATILLERVLRDFSK